MVKYYVYGEKTTKMKDMSNLVKNWHEMPSLNGYKAVGIYNDEGNACDIIVEKNGEISISKDWEKLGWTINKGFWADVYFLLSLSQVAHG